MGIGALGNGRIIVPSVNSGLGFGGCGPRGFLFDIGSMSRMITLYSDFKSDVERSGMNYER